MHVTFVETLHAPSLQKWNNINTILVSLHYHSSFFFLIPAKNGYILSVIR